MKSIFRRSRSVFIAAGLSLAIIGCDSEGGTTESELEDDAGEVVVVAEPTPGEQVMSDDVEEGDRTKRPSPFTTREGTIDGVMTKVEYGSPAVKGRTVYGDLVPYNEIWRTGANEATTVEFGQDVRVAGKKLAKGKYSLFTIPTEGEWTVIFNKKPEQWGAYNYDEADDALRVQVKPAPAPTMSERLHFTVEPEGIKYSWENTMLMIPVKKA